MGQWVDEHGPGILAVGQDFDPGMFQWPDHNRVFSSNKLLDM